jgi:hypothetical protein
MPRGSTQRTLSGTLTGGVARLGAAAIVSLLLLAGAAPARAVAAGCDRVASPGGSDSAAGTETQPFRTVQKLADSLAAGQTGCLRAGSYSGNVKVTSSGAAGAPLVITSYPGERAQVVGRLLITDSANFVTIASLDLDGRNAANLPSPGINGDDVTFVDNDVTNQNTSICFNLGPTTYGRANRTVIERNRIHNCGELPATNLDHGIYVEHTTGVRIVENLIYDNADRGVQLYPDAQSTYVARNVIDSNGEGVLIAGGSEEFGPQASSDNVVEHNIITNSNQRYNVEWHWGSSLVGERNVVRQNCIFGGARDADRHGLAPDNGYTSSDNLLADPQYVNSAGKDFSLRPDSPCRDLASYRTPSGSGGGQPSGAGIVLDTPKSALQPGRSVPITGRVTGAHPPRQIVLRTRRGKHWRRIGKARVNGNGRFKLRVRLRSGPKRLHRRSGLSVRTVRLARRTRALRMRATATRIGSSNTVRVRVRR